METPAQSKPKMSRLNKITLLLFALMAMLQTVFIFTGNERLIPAGEEVKYTISAIVLAVFLALLAMTLIWTGYIERRPGIERIVFLISTAHLSVLGTVNLVYWIVVTLLKYAITDLLTGGG